MDDIHSVSTGAAVFWQAVWQPRAPFGLGIDECNRLFTTVKIFPRAQESPLTRRRDDETQTVDF